MKGTTKIGTLCLNGLAIFLTIIFVISIVTMSGNTVSVQAETIKSQREDMSDKKAAVKKNRWTRLIQKYEKSEKVNQLIFVVPFIICVSFLFYSTLTHHTFKRIDFFKRITQSLGGEAARSCLF